MRRAVVLGTICLLWPLGVGTLATNASAHPLAPALLELRELAPGRTSVLWRTPARLPGSASSSFGPSFPAHCRTTRAPLTSREGSGMTTRWEISCLGSLAGQEIEIRGLATSGASALLRIVLIDGRQIQKLVDPKLSPSGSRFRIPERSVPLSVLFAYGELGWRHILSGADHLLFVLGLMLMVRGRRQLLLTVTAFTVGHSLTLSLAVLGWLRLPQAPVEALIALSIAALAVELVNQEAVRQESSAGSTPAATPSAKFRPPLLATGFGLLHGLGFAGALREIGVAQDEIALSLLSFNIGIEAGQLAFMAALWMLAAVARRMPEPSPGALRALRLSLAYAMGSLAAFWFYQRVFAGH